MRIVSLAPSNTEILYAIGAGNDVVANTRFCDYPEEAKSKPKVGGWLDVNDELVKKYEPDVVMTSTFVQGKVAERYKKLSVKLFHTDPKTLEQVYDSVVAIGKLAGKEAAAASVVADMKKKLCEIKDDNSGSNGGRKVRVYCEEWHRPPTASGNWVAKIIEIAGGESYCPEGKVSHPVTAAEIAEFDPDIIVLSLCGFGDQATADIVKNRSGWQELRAVNRNKVFVIDDSLLNRPGPRLAEGARFLSGLLKKNI